MKKLTRVLVAIAIVATFAGCISRKERIVERERDRDTERPVVREQVIERPSSAPSTTIVK